MTIATRIRGPLEFADFRLLIFGETVSVLGSQFHIVALQWLTLLIAPQGGVLAAMMMVGAVPRAALMLVGGSLVDRIGPRRIMLLSNFVRAGLTAGIALLVQTDMATVSALLTLAFLFGVADALFFPSLLTVIPRLVPQSQLGSSNALLQGAMSVMGFVGPMVAGVLLSLTSLSVAFWIDAVGLIIAAIAISMIRTHLGAPERSEPAGSFLSEAIAGLRYAWTDPVIRVIMLVNAVTTVAFQGPFSIGTALFVKESFDDTQSFGFLMGASGVGSLAGTIVAGLLPVRLPFRIFLSVIPIGLGLSMFGMAVSTSLVAALALRVVSGMIAGYAGVYTLSFLQGHVRQEMMGQTMSFIMFISVGLMPISYSVVGLLAYHGSAFLFMLGGACMLLAAPLALSVRMTRAPA